MSAIANASVKPIVQKNRCDCGDKVAFYVPQKCINFQGYNNILVWDNVTK